MFEFNPISLAYGVMVVGMVLCFIASRKVKKGIRGGADGFVFRFVEISNYVSPMPPSAGLAVEELKGGKVRALPLKEQSKEIRDIVKRANGHQVVQMFAELVNAEAEVEELAGKNRTYKEQFYAPIHRTLLMTHTFLNGCENLDTIDTDAKRRQFDSFLLEQVDHRLMLLKRISGEKSEEYAKMNKVYADEMEARELAEIEQRMNRGKKAPQKK